MRLSMVMTALALSGCSLFLGDGGDGDGDGDGDIDAGLESYAPWQLSPVRVDQLAGQWEVASPCTIDTTAVGATDCDETPMVIDGFATIRADTVRIESTLRVTGDLPLVIVARSISIAGSIDGIGGSPFNAGEIRGACLSASAAVDEIGGSGAGFNGAGAAGGGGGPASEGITADQLIGIQAGCYGGISSSDDVAAPGGAGIQLVATTRLIVSGGIFAHGGGGAGGVNNLGGGGGGSGGVVVLDSPAIEVGSTAKILAFGGGGGSGGAPAATGVPGTTVPDDFCPVGGNGPGVGGAGACRDQDAQPGGQDESSGAGGGGGGAAGFILVHGAIDSLEGDVSPAIEVVE